MLKSRLSQLGEVSQLGKDVDRLQTSLKDVMMMMMLYS